MADGDKGIVKSTRGKVLTCFRRISSKLEPAGTKGCDEELGIAMFGCQIIQIAHGRQAEG